MCSVQKIEKSDINTPMLRVQLKSSEAKREILRQKKEKLGSSRVYIEPDRTPEDQKIFIQLLGKVKDAKRAEKSATIRNRTITIDGKLFYWDPDS